MVIKRYLVNDLSEGVQRIKQDLGPKALVLSARKTTRPNGRFGLLKRPAIEVTAMQPENTEPSSDQKLSNTILQNKKAIRSALEKVRYLENMASGLFDLAKAAQLGINPELLKFRNRLEKQDLDPKLLSDLLGHVISAKNSNISSSPESLARSFIANRLEKKDSLIEKGIIFFVGTRGSGKTGLITKLAAKRVITGIGPTALVSADITSRHAALHVKRLGSLLQIPTSVVLEAGTLSNALETVRRPGALILVDLPGADPGEVIATLSKLFSQQSPDSIHLVLDASQSTSDMLIATQAYQAVNPDRVDFTKLDLTSAFGGVWSVLLSTGLNAGFLSAGPTMPEDLVETTPQNLAALPFESAEGDDDSQRETA
ncbi:MAG: hypothetical protein GXP49_12370 [Deltaproteobacteria bacterium]|nr:hypothetical protein [Deltaproteobacteria bacterium]